jgi:hypothetical protein
MFDEMRNFCLLRRPRAVQTVGRTLAMPVLVADCTTNISERKFPTETASKK